MTMTVEKKKIAELTKCYCVAPFRDQRGEHLLVASEKDFPCLMFSPEGVAEETLWENPGGVMSMVQMPGVRDCLLTTKRFYSPNDSKQAYIAAVYREQGAWKEHMLCALPHVHRFDIIPVNGSWYLFAATLLSRRDIKDDWSYPGKVYAAKLPEDPRGATIEPVAVREGLLKNHGYTSVVLDGQKTPVIAADCGVFAYHPVPCGERVEWREEQLTADAASEMRFIDLDGDGQDEMVVCAPFHGDTLRVYKQGSGRWEPVYEYPAKIPFAHAMCALTAGGRTGAVIGHREGDMDLLFLYWDGARYAVDIIDRGAGSANALSYTHAGREYLISANRQVNEVCLYAFDRS